MLRRTRRRRRSNNLLMPRIMLLAFFVIAIYMAFLNYDQRQVSVSPPAEGEIRVHFIDVGQGDSVLIQSTNHAVLIDAGPTVAGQNIVTYLNHFGITTIDYVVATHPHADHIGGMPHVLDRFIVHNLWMPDRSHTTDTFDRFLDAIERNEIQITTIEAGASLSAGPIQMMAVAPNSSGHDNLNDYSIVLHMQHGGTSFLFTGDAEAISENEILAAGWHIQADVLDVGHHGSRTSSTDRFLDAVQPSAAIIQVGADNQFGHPHREVMDRFAERGITVLQTAEMGNIVLSTNGVDIYLYD